MKITKSKADDESEWKTDDSSDKNALTNAIEELKLQNEIEKAATRHYSRPAQAENRGPVE